MTQRAGAGVGRLAQPTAAPEGPSCPATAAPAAASWRGGDRGPGAGAGRARLGGPLFSVPLNPGLGAGLPKLSHSVTAGCVATWPPPGRIHPFPEAGLSNEVEGTKARERWLLFYKTLYAPCTSPSPRSPPALIQPQVGAAVPEHATSTELRILRLEQSSTTDL